jgi:hypothetical protein
MRDDGSVGYNLESIPQAVDQCYFQPNGPPFLFAKRWLNQCTDKYSVRKFRGFGHAWPYMRIWVISKLHSDYHHPPTLQHPAVPRYLPAERRVPQNWT